MDARSDKWSFGWWLCLPVLLILASGYVTMDALIGLTYAPLGRDQGIFQYTAWALRNGQRLYVDFHEINGPLPHVLHWGYQLLGGEDTRTFRILDLCVTSSAYFWIGTRIPRGGTAKSVRAAWGIAGLLAFASQYVSYGWWHTAQREHYFTLLMGIAIGAILPDLRGDEERGASVTGARAARWFFSGACIAAPCFGKPTCALYFLMFVAAVFLIRKFAAQEARETKLSPPNIRAFGIGVLVCSLFFLGFIARYGDFAACWKFVVVETARFHRYFWILSFRECYSAHGNAPRLNIALITLVLGGIAMVRRRLPPYALIAMVPLVGGIVTYFAQQKGFPYHLHPVGFGVRLLWLFLVEAGIAELAKQPRGPFRGAKLEAGAFAASAAGLLLWYASGDASYAESRNSAWRRTNETEGEHLTHFRSKDFEPAYIAEAADYLRGVLPTDGRIQMYGFDPYLMFRARRLSGSPFIYAFDLQAKSVTDEKRAKLPEATRTWIEQLLADNRQELTSKMVHAPPDAVVFVDRTPFDYPDDSRADFADCCAEADAFVRTRYHAAKTFGTVRVWLRNDIDQAR